MAQVEVVSILGSIGLLAVVVEMIRRRELTENYSLLWLVTAVALIVLSLWRELLDVLAKGMGIFYPPAALFVVSFGFFLLILLQFSVVISHLSKKNRQLAQEVGLLKWKVDQYLNETTDNSDQESRSG